MSFKQDIDKFSKKTNAKIESVLRGTALALFTNIVIRTPVDTGRLRLNWQPTLKKPATGTFEVGGGSGTPISKVRAVVGRAKFNSTIYFANNLPYAQAIEDGHSKEKAPRGMVAVAVAEFPRITRAEARKVANK